MQLNFRPLQNKKHSYTTDNSQKNFSVNLPEAFPWAKPEPRWKLDSNSWLVVTILFSKALIPEKRLFAWLIIAREQAPRGALTAGRPRTREIVFPV